MMTDTTTRFFATIPETTGANWSSFSCALCGFKTEQPNQADLGCVRGNTERFKSSVFPLWRCPECGSIHNVQYADLSDIYRGYPLNSKRRLDIFARRTMGSLLRRLVHGGLQKHHAILDFGAGDGLFIEFLKQKGYTKVTGYDPFVERFAHYPAEKHHFDCVVANDVVEHVEDPWEMMRQCVELTRRGGLLYVGTADSAGVGSMQSLDRHIMRLHQPFHRVIINERGLHRLGRDIGLEKLASWRRSYMDTPFPFGSYRFLDEFSRSLDHNMDRMLAPDAGKILASKPSLLFYGLFGYLMPSAYEPAVLWRTPD